MGDFENADMLLNRLAQLHPAQDQNVADALCEAISVMIEPLYRCNLAGVCLLSSEQEHSGWATGDSEA